MSDQPDVPLEPLEDLPQTPAALAAWVDEKLMRLADLEAQERTIREVEDRRTADIAKWAADEVAKVERQATFFKAQLLQVAKTFPYAGKAKSINLPYGSIGTRVQPLSVEIRDPVKALGYALGNDVPVTVAIETTDPSFARELRLLADRWSLDTDESVGKAELLAHAKKQRAEDPAWNPHALDDGWQLYGGGDEPFVRVRKEDQ